MTYAPKELAKIAGVSVRTLHYYDQIGLVVPSRTESNDYRSYCRSDLHRLQQVLFFRELKLPLKKIKAILDSPSYDERETLRDQYSLIKIERDRLNQILKTISKTIQSQGVTMTDQELYGGLSKEKIDEYTNEASQRWGKKAVQESWQKIKSWDKKNWTKANKEHRQACRQLVSCLDMEPDSDAAQRAIDKHYQWLSKFGDYNWDMYRALGQMYFDDPRFRATYAEYHPELPLFMAKAISIYCDRRLREKTKLFN